MIILADVETREIYGRYEAWDAGAYKTAIRDAKEIGEIVKDEITLMGDMVIWVKVKVK